MSSNLAKSRDFNEGRRAIAVMLLINLDLPLISTVYLLTVYNSLLFERLMVSVFVPNRYFKMIIYFTLIQ